MSSRASIHDDSRFQPPFILDFHRESKESSRFACQFCALRKETSGRIAAMKRRTLLQSLPAITLLPAAEWLASAQDKPGSATSTTTVYELRVYHAYEGKLDDLLRRFREHTVKLVEKHGIKNVAYWAPLDEPLKGRTLIYILEHPSREAATANWQAFRDDPEWQSARDKSEANGKLVEKGDWAFMALKDFAARW